MDPFWEIELSKLRAQAFVHLMSLLGEHQAVFNTQRGYLNHSRIV